MDETNWCLFCAKSCDAPYCNFQCRLQALDSQVTRQRSEPDHTDDDDYSDDDEEPLYHNVDDISEFYANITAWAENVTPGPPPANPPTLIHHSSSSSVRSSRSKNGSPTSVATVTYRPPELLRPHRAVPAPLCMSTPRTIPASPSRPIITPKQHMVELSATYSVGTSSESSLATPASSHQYDTNCTLNRKSAASSVFESIAFHVRSWVTPSPLASKQATPQKRTLSDTSSQSDEKAVPILLSPPTKFPRQLQPSRLVNQLSIQNTIRKPSAPFPRDEIHPSYRARGRKIARACT